MTSLAAPLAALLVTVAISGCGEDEEPAAEVSELEGVPWVLASGVEVVGWEDVAPSATFADGRVAGSTGCNRFNGAYTADGESLELSQVASTEMACMPPADAVESAFLAALQRVAVWGVEDDELVLHDADHEEVLRFRAATPVGSWQVTAFLREGSVSSPVAGTEITASFAESGALSGSSGCNGYTSSFTTERGAIEIAQPAGTKKLCAEPEGIMEQEAAYLAALPKAVRYEVDGRSLRLLTAEATVVATFSHATDS
jgi:heat shock protein HslJ